jgi:preprotein translocase subunit SecD
MDDGHRRWAPTRAALLGVALAMLAATGCSGGSPAQPPAAASRSIPTGPSNGGLARFEFPTRAVSSAQLGAVVPVIAARLKTAGLPDATVKQTPTAIQVNAPANAAHIVAVAGHAGQFRFRPVLQQLNPCPSATTSPPQDDPNSTVTLPQRDPQQGCYRLGPALLRGDFVASASAEPPAGPGTDWVIALALTPDGSVGLDRIAAAYLHQQIAMVVDSVVVSAPVLQTDHYNGQAEISGKFSQQQAQDLATELCCGSLPVSLPPPTQSS